MPHGSTSRIIMIAFLLVLAGCSGGDTAGRNNDRELALLNESQTVMTDVESYW